MDPATIRIKLFDIHKSLKNIIKQDKQDAQDAKLPRIYHLKPEDIEAKYISVSNANKANSNMKKKYNKK